MGWLLWTLATLWVAAGEEWYMPDSSLISDQEFQQKIIDDKSCFKFVKYFTPHCPYCRYLKAVFDTLKHRKEWCFSIYELNCQWYPQFCRENVHSSSFPYTVIYDQDGKVAEEIHGFYPEPIIATIFDRIEQLCLSLKQQALPTTVETPQIVAQTQNSLSAEVHTQTEHHQQSGQVRLQQQQPVHEIRRTQEQESKHPKSAQPLTDNQKEIISESHSHEASKAKEVPSYISYGFYGICLIVAAFYIRSLHSQSSETPAEPQEKRSGEQKERSEEDLGLVKQTGNQEEDSDLLQIPDDQL